MDADERARFAKRVDGLEKKFQKSHEPPDDVTPEFSRNNIVLNITLL